MSSLRTMSALALGALGGCSVLTGASDLRTDPSFTGANTPDDARIEPGTEGGPNDGGSSGDGSGGPTLDASTTRLREITFEKGALTGLLGADTLTGSPMVVKTNTLAGAYSMGVTTVASYATVAFPAAKELYATLLFSIPMGGALPPDGLTVTIGRFSSTMVAPSLDVTLTRAGLAVAVGGTSLGIGAVVPGVVYRLGVHIGAGGALDVKVAEGATTPFGQGGASLGGSSLGATATVTFGAIDRGVVGVFDNLLLDTGAMPAP